MSMLYVDGHSDHTQSWIFALPSETSPTCLACLLCLLEDDALIPIQKKPALAALASLVQQSSEAVSCLRDNLTITSHCLLTLMELLKLDESTFVVQVLDVCVKVIGKVESEDLVRLVLDIIQTEGTSAKDCRGLCPLYLLLGRLVQNYTSLAIILGQQYDALLQQLCSSLTVPDEDLQSAVVYIFVYTLVGDWPNVLSTQIQRQIIQEVVCILNTGKAQGLLLNCLGLLKKLVTNSDSTQLLMKLNLGGVTLLSVLKKLLVSKKDVQQISAIQILSSILQGSGGHSYGHTPAIIQSDLIEFLFECLHTRNMIQTRHIFQCLKPLCQMEQFYTKCHSVYGIESILRALEILADMRNYELSEEGLKILATVLTKHPSNVPLFINAKMVQLCLSIISRGLKQPHPLIFSASLSALGAIIRKDHLLLPVPFEELEGVMMVCNKTLWLRAQTSRGGIPPHGETKRKGDRQSRSPGEGTGDIHTYCQVHLMCVQLLKACVSDPTSSVSTYSAPPVSTNQKTSVQVFQDFILRSSAETCIPLVVNELEETENVDLLVDLSALICRLDDLDTNFISDVVYRLCNTGVMTTVLDIHTQHGTPRTDSGVVAELVLVMCQALHRMDKDTVHPFPAWTPDTLGAAVQYKLQDLPKIVSQVSLKVETKEVYLFMMFYTFRNDEMVMSGQELQCVLSEMCASSLVSGEFSPLAKKHFIFLTAIAFCLGDNSQASPDHQMLDTVTQILTECPVKEWYTHHLAILRWTFQNQPISRVCGHKVIEAWLSRLCTLEAPEGGDAWLRDNPDVLSLLELCQERCLTGVLLDLFFTSSEAIVRVTRHILHCFIDQMSDEDERMDYLEFLCKQTADRLQQMFLDKTLHEPGLEALLVLRLYSQEHIPGTVSTSDIKIIHHVTKLVGSTDEVSLLLTCVQYILSSVQGSNTAATHTVLSMVIQNEDLLGKLENLCADTNPALSAVATSIVLEMIQYCSRPPNHQCKRLISMDLLPVSRWLDTDHTALLLTRLDLLCVMFQLHFTSSLVRLAHTERYPRHAACPFTSKEIREVYIHLQQLLLQELVAVRIRAVQCIQAIFSYLNTVDPKLEHYLRTHPWNFLLLEVAIQMSDTDDETLHCTVLLIQQLLCGLPPEQGVLQTSPHLASVLLDFILHRDRTNLTPAHQTSLKVLAKQLMKILPETMVSKHQDMLNTLVQC